MKAANTCGILSLQPCRRLILCRSTLLLILPIHRHHHHRVPPQGSCRPPVQLSLTCTTVVCNEYLILQPLHVCWAGRWENSNAESFRGQNFNYNNFDDDDEGNEDYSSLEQGNDVLQEYIDSIWIFKVLRSYGWALPFIIISMLLTTGPKPFLMALALPIWQSTFSFALKKMWDGKGKSKRKNKTRSTSRSDKKFGKGKNVGRQGNKKPKMGYRSWVSSYDDSSFGGWDQLEGGNDEFQLGPSTRSAQRVGRSQKSPSEKSRLTERIRKSDTPLLLRLLIAVFPFLASWTKML